VYVPCLTSARQAAKGLQNHTRREDGFKASGFLIPPGCCSPSRIVRREGTQIVTHIHPATRPRVFVCRTSSRSPTRPVKTLPLGSAASSRLRVVFSNDNGALRLLDFLVSGDRHSDIQSPCSPAKSWCLVFSCRAPDHCPLLYFFNRLQGCLLHYLTPSRGGILGSSREL